jgi:methionyl-tRNA formyltransferase
MSSLAQMAPTVGGRPPRRVVFIGDRVGVYEAAAAFPELAVEWTIAVAGSRLQRRLVELGRPHDVLDPVDKLGLIERLESLPFDLLISNGCPVILPIGRLTRPGRLFVNVHPSPLPDMRGRNPVNGALLLGRRWAGATLHFMDDGMDTGRIIARERVRITPDIDLGLLYHVVFELEAAVFTAGMRRLIDSGFTLRGRAQGPGTSYSGRERDARVDLAAMPDAEILRRVRAFGVRTQGCDCLVGGSPHRIFEARPVSSGALLAEFEHVAAGEVALAWDGKLLVRSRDGLIALVSWAVADERGAAGG